MEEWRDINGFEGRYRISSLGRILSLPKEYTVNVFNKAEVQRMTKERIIKGRRDKNGYTIVNLSDSNGILHNCKVHRLVAFAFIPKVEGKDLINHKNGIKNDNRVENLEWCTLQENATHASKVLHVKYRKGRKICQYLLDGTFVKEYSSITEAAMALNTTRSTLFACCSGKVKHSCGYQWQYSDGSYANISAYNGRRPAIFGKVMAKANIMVGIEGISLSEALRKVWVTEKTENQ